jgi:tetratricopeptide (TPR) repeat protein
MQKIFLQKSSGLKMLRYIPMRHDRFSEDLQNIVSTSREIAISNHHRYIHTDHLFMAMLQQHCLAAPFLNKIDRRKWADITSNHPSSVTTVALSDSLPLTIDAERILMHAWTFAFSREKTTTNSVDLLLAMLAYDNPIKDDLSRAGWLLDHILQQQYGADITFPTLPLKERTTISKLRWTLMSKEKRDEVVSRLHRHALILIKYYMYEEVREICNTVLAVSKEHADFITLLALITYHQRDYSLVYPLLEKLEQFSSKIEWCQQMRTNIEAKKGNYTPSILRLEQQLTAEPENIIFLNDIGYYLSKQGKFTVAVSNLEKAIQLAPNYGYAYNNLGFALYRLGNQQSGINAIRQSLELDMGNPYTYKNLGIIYMEIGDNVNAKEQFELALKYRYTALYDNEVLELLEQLNES